MGYLQKKENRNAAQARNSFVTRKAEQKLNALTDTFKTAAEHHYADERRDTLQRTLNFKDFRYLDNLRFVYNWENRFLSVSVINRDSGMADAYSTAVFNMDLEEGRAFVEKTDDLEALWILPDGTHVESSGWAAYRKK